MNILHRIASVALSGFVWMATWGAIGATFSILAGIVAPGWEEAGEAPVDLAIIIGPVGLASGIVFGLLLAVVERRRGVADVPILRAIVWGIAAALAVRLLTNMSEAVVWIIVLLGAVSGPVSVALARGLRRKSPALPATAPR